MNTPRALERLFALTGHVSANEGKACASAAKELKAAGGLLGLLQDEQRLKAAREGKSNSSSAPVSAKERAWIEERVAARETARKRQDFAAADAIRVELASQGVEIEDSREGACWRIVASRQKQAQKKTQERATG